MALALFKPGRITAALLNAAFSAVKDVVAYKGAGTGRNTTTSLTLDPDLQVPVEANTEYLVDLDFCFDGPTAADLKISWSGPSGATMANWSAHYQDPTTHIDVTNAAIGTVQNIATDTTVRPGQVRGTLLVAATAGTFGLTWAQLVSNGSDVTIGAGSRLRLTPIS